MEHNTTRHILTPPSPPLISSSKQRQDDVALRANLGDTYLECINILDVVGALRCGRTHRTGVSMQWLEGPQTSVWRVLISAE